MGPRAHRVRGSLTIRESPGEQFWARLSAEAASHPVPIQAMIELTYGCNLRCVHCFNPTHRANGELTTAQIKALVDQLVGAGCLDLAFTGGEVFTRRDLFEIVRSEERRVGKECRYRWSRYDKVNTST